MILDMTAIQQDSDKEQEVYFNFISSIKSDITKQNYQSNPVCIKCNNKDNPVGSEFCNSCGSPLSPICPKCGLSNPSSALFCGQCGSKL